LVAVATVATLSEATVGTWLVASIRGAAVSIFVAILIFVSTSFTMCIHDHRIVIVIVIVKADLVLLSEELRRAGGSLAAIAVVVAPRTIFNSVVRAICACCVAFPCLTDEQPVRRDERLRGVRVVAVPRRPEVVELLLGEAGFEVVVGVEVVLEVVLVTGVAVVEDARVVTGEVAHVARRDPGRDLVGGGAHVAPVGLDDVRVVADELLELGRRVAEEQALVRAAGEDVGEGEGDGQAHGRQREEGERGPLRGALHPFAPLASVAVLRARDCESGM
jgi:hypothetical protein